MRVAAFSGAAVAMFAVLCEIAACRRSNPLPLPVATPPASPPIDNHQGVAEARPSPPSVRSYPAAEPWARWHMPNARLPGLPNPRNYETLSEGVVVDRITGLMWQRNLRGQFVTFQDAQRTCDALTLAGHDDWRLPSRIELVSILDTTRTQPAIDVDAFPDTPSDWFWTSSLAAGNPNAAWYVYFYFGYPKTDDMTNRFSVRCVRTMHTPDPAATRYDVRPHEVADIATGLVWQRGVPVKTFAFQAAHSYCEHLRQGEKKGWRVPTLVELLTLIDERASTPMIDRTAFPATPAESFWTSSTFANGNELAWYVRFSEGDGLYGRLVESFRVRCVR